MQGPFYSEPLYLAKPGLMVCQMPVFSGEIMGSDKGNIVNFSDFRQKSKKSGKKETRQEKAAKAAANRVRTGRTGAEKKAAKLLKERERRLHEGRRLTPHDGLQGETAKVPTKSTNPEDESGGTEET